MTKAFGRLTPPVTAGKFTFRAAPIWGVVWVGVKSLDKQLFTNSFRS